VIFLFCAHKILAQIFSAAPIGLATLRRSANSTDLVWRRCSQFGKEDLGFDPVGQSLKLTHPSGWEDRIQRFIEVLDTGIPILRETVSYCDTFTGIERSCVLSLLRLDWNTALMCWVDVTIEHKAAAEIAAARDLLKAEIETDALTGAGSRAKLKALVRYGEPPVGTIAIDLNRFKSINDGIGHNAGDELLRSVAARLQSRLSPHEHLFRPAGDEFIILIQSPEKPELQLARAESIVSVLEEPFWIDRHEVRISASAGVANHSAGDLESQLAAADRAMYVAKHSARGHNACSLWSEELVEVNREKQRISIDLRRAVATCEEFELFYQPVVSLLTKKPVGVEALLRWNSPTLGAVPPGVFIPLAEASGEIYEISEWVLKRAILQSKAWGERFEIAVNLSPWDLERKGFRDRLLTLCDNVGISPSSIALEITERAVQSDLSHFESVLTSLAECRIFLKLDDFGTGDSGVARIASAIPWHEIKFDRTLLPTSNMDERRVDVCCGLIALCDRLDISTLAEGVETKEQADLCRHLGFDTAQGYYFSRPMPAHEIELDL
jgi:diguanylate cyclase (GGDEF)-like protein